MRPACARDSLVMLDLAAQLYPAPPAGQPRDARWLRAAFEQDSADALPSADSVVAFTRAVMARARAALPRAFAHVPTDEVVLAPFPAYQQPTAPGGSYTPGAPDGSRPGTYNYRTYPPVHRTGLAPTVVHETWLGHHLQFALARPGVDRARAPHRIARLALVPAFAEGWALYGEGLADELGVYVDARDRLGRYGWLAPLLLADLGMNTRGWSAAAAEQYLLGSAPLMPPARIRRAVANLTGSPGYVASYTVGALEFERLRREAEAALGPRFDLRAFHDVVLGDGAVPLALVRTRVARWVRSRSVE